MVSPLRPPQTRILTLRQVVERTSLSRATVARLRAKDAFPQPIRLSGNRVGWQEHELEAWLRSRSDRSA
jgi:prophage regulatory protein